MQTVKLAGCKQNSISETKRRGNQVNERLNVSPDCREEDFVLGGLVVGADGSQEAMALHQRPDLSRPQILASLKGPRLTSEALHRRANCCVQVKDLL